MYCSKCGIENSECNRFCSSCGNVLSEYQQNFQPNRQNTPYQGPSYTAYQPHPKKPFSNNPVLNALKTMGASPLFLTAIIAFSVSVFFNLLANLSASSSGLIDTFYDALSDLGISYYFSESYSNFENLMVTTTVMGMIPQILIAIGLWMTFASAIDRSRDGMTITGLNIIQFVNIVYLVVYNILFGAIEVLLLIATAGLADSRYTPDGAITVMVVVIFVVAGIDVLINLYYSKILKTLKTIKTAIFAEEPLYNVSKFVAVMCFISAIFSFFGLFSVGGSLAFLTVSATVTSLICFGILLFRYMNKMLALSISMGRTAKPTPFYQVQPAISELNSQDPQQYMRNS